MPGSTLICCMKRSSSERKHQRFKGKSPNIIPLGSNIYTYFIHTYRGAPSTRISLSPWTVPLLSESFWTTRSPVRHKIPLRTLCSSVLSMAEIQGGSWYWYLIPLFAPVLAPSFRWFIAGNHYKSTVSLHRTCDTKSSWPSSSGLVSSTFNSSWSAVPQAIVGDTNWSFGACFFSTKKGTIQSS